MEVGVSSIPVSEVCSLVIRVRFAEINVISLQFYCEEHTAFGENYARFAFCKDIETLKKAAGRLQGLQKFLQ